MPRSACDAFKKARTENAPFRLQIGSESIPILLTYTSVREAAKNWQMFSSDAPFRVPIPSEENQRSVRQIPIETDPPMHRKYRALVEPFFRRPMQAAYIAQIDKLVRTALRACTQKASFDAVRDLALPIQSQALACLLGVPQKEADTWIAWGTHVLYDGLDSASKGADLNTYLVETLQAAKAEQNPESFFSALHMFKLEDRFLTTEEMLGIANLVFAGGRDTVINTMTFLIAYFAEHPEALARAAATLMTVNLAVEESIRVVSPLTQIGRVCKAASADLGTRSGERVSLCWAAANYDPEIFKDPERIDLARSPNPHVGFGSGHHSCLGAAQARTILRSFIRGLSDLGGQIRVIESVPKLETFGLIEREVGFERLTACLIAESRRDASR